MLTGKTIYVTAFIDWDVTRRLVDFKEGQRLSDRQIQLVFQKFQELLADRLMEMMKSTFRVNFKLYHGWYAGLTPTDDRKSIESSIQRSPISRVLKSVIFTGECEFSDRLSCGGPRHKLFDTLRIMGGNPRQKMVDTGMTVDALLYARSHAKVQNRLLLIVGDDDDLLPAAFAAESMEANVKVVRNFFAPSKHLITKDLVIWLSGVPK